MANSSAPKKVPPSPLDAERCWKNYNYIVHSKGNLMVGGELHFPTPVSPREATKQACRVTAKSAFDLELPFDPFNVNILVRPTKRRTKIKS